MWREHWDPEGLLSTIPAIGTALFGIMVGDWLRLERPPTDRALGLLLAGGMGIVIGMVWDHWFPINKNLWTSSYAVFTAGIAAQLLGALYALVDIWGYRRWAWPSLVLGSNALLVFALSGLLARVLNLIRVTEGDGQVGLGGWIYSHVFVTWAGPLNGSLAFAVAVVLLFVALLAVPYRRGWFLRF